MSWARRLALAGVVGPPLFWIVVAIVTFLEWDFLHSIGWGLVQNHRVPYPSATALGQFGLLQVLNFGQVGLAIVAIALGLWTSAKPRPRAGIVFVFLGGVALLASMFKTDLSMAHATWHGWIHALAFVLLVFSTVLGMLTLAFGLRKDDRWRAVGYLGVVFAVVFVVAFVVGGRTLPDSVSGLVSIFTLLILFSWYEVLAIKLLSLAR
jgi:hypothetical protein